MLILNFAQSGKKILSIWGVLFLIIALAGCSNGDGSVADRAADQATEMATKPIDISKKAKEDIAKAIDEENEKLSNTLKEENNMSSNELKAPVIDQDLIKKYPFATIKTSLGDIKVKFNGSATPLTVTNFLQLAESKFYDNVKFHRVIKGFMIQAGDPLSKDDAMKNRWGTGGPGYKFKDELAGTEKYPQGTLAMANSGPNTNGSQFFIVTASPAAQLPASYTVFGEVVDGIDVALKIENVQTTTPDRPVEDVSIISVTPAEK